jgi:hypothetical protein
VHVFEIEGKMCEERKQEHGERQSGHGVGEREIGREEERR